MLDRILVLGGGSEIAAAFVSRVMADDAHDDVLAVLAGRPGGTRDLAAQELAQAHTGLRIETVDFDATDATSHSQVLAAIDETHGPFDTIVVAFGQLGGTFTIDADPAAMAELAHVNFAGAVSSSLAALNMLRGEPRAHLIVFSSIAAVRPRVGNLVYGSAKAGLDAFARELAAPAAQVGVQVVVVRPGFVHGRMTHGLDPAPFATTPEQVADDMFDGIAAGRSIIHSPNVLGPVGLVLKNLPGTIWRRVSAR